MDPATVTALTTGTKIAYDALRAALEAKKRGSDKDAGNALALMDDLHQRLVQLQDVALRLQSELAQAREENGHLRTQICEKEGRSADHDNYELRGINGGRAMVHRDHPDAYLCPTCFEGGRKVYLTVVPREVARLVTHKCSICNFAIPKR
jgi:hypothetical protein